MKVLKNWRDAKCALCGTQGKVSVGKYMDVKCSFCGSECLVQDGKAFEPVWVINTRNPIRNWKVEKERRYSERSLLC